MKRYEILALKERLLKLEHLFAWLEEMQTFYGVKTIEEAYEIISKQIQLTEEELREIEKVH
jgi:hypothetical protein